MKKKILLGMALVLDEALDWHEVLTSRRNLYLTGHYKKQSFYNTISGFLKTGDLEKIINKKGEAVYRITSRGQTKIRYSIPLLRYVDKKWNGIWTLISFDIPFKQGNIRKRLLAKLKELGFGMLQESLWMTPHDIGVRLEEFLITQNLKDYCIVWRAKTIFGENEKEMVNRVWKLDDLQEQYRNLIEKFEKIGTNKRLEEERRKDWTEEYFNLLAVDPGLPKELLLEDWLFEKVKRLYQKEETI